MSLIPFDLKPHKYILAFQEPKNWYGIPKNSCIFNRSTVNLLLMLAVSVFIKCMLGQQPVSGLVAQ